MILRPQPNQPLILSLKYPKGKEKPGKYGLQFEYVTTAGEILYLPPLAKSQIDSLNLSSGEPFQLVKKIGQGNAVQWEVERVPQNGNGAKSEGIPRRPPVSATVVSRTAIAQNHTTDGPELTTEESRRLHRQLVAAIDAAHAAEQHAKAIGYSVLFNSEDIRALAISCFIQQSHGRRAA